MDLYAPKASTLPEILHHLSHLKHLKLHCVERSLNADKVWNVLSRLSKLEILELNGENSMNWIAFEENNGDPWLFRPLATVFPCLRFLKCLEEGKAIQHDQLSKLPSTLTTLHLPGVHFSPQIFEHFPLKYLSTLEIGFNNDSTTDTLSNLPPSITSFASNFNKIEGGFLIPDILASHPSLTKLIMPVDFRSMENLPPQIESVGVVCSSGHPPSLRTPRLPQIHNLVLYIPASTPFVLPVLPSSLLSLAFIIHPDGSSRVEDLSNLPISLTDLELSSLFLDNLELGSKLLQLPNLTKLSFSVGSALPKTYLAEFSPKLTFLHISTNSTLATLENIILGPSKSLHTLHLTNAGLLSYESLAALPALSDLKAHITEALEPHHAQNIPATLQKFHTFHAPIPWSPTSIRSLPCDLTTLRITFQSYDATESVWSSESLSVLPRSLTSIALPCIHFDAISLKALPHGLLALRLQTVPKIHGSVFALLPRKLRELIIGSLPQSAISSYCELAHMKLLPPTLCALCIYSLNFKESYDEWCMVADRLAEFMPPKLTVLSLNPRINQWWLSR